MRGIDHSCVKVDDFASAIAWYGEKLGVSVEKRWKVERLPGVDIACLRGQSGSRLEIVDGAALV